MRRRDFLHAVTAASLSGCSGSAPAPEGSTPLGQTGPILHAYGDSQSQVGELRLPGAAPRHHPVVIVLHGGFWYASYGRSLMVALCDAFTSLGVATWNVEYRRVGEAGGGWPGTLRDVGTAADA